MQNTTSLYNFLCYTQNPGYFDLVYGLFKTVKWYYSPAMMKSYSFPFDFIHDFFHAVEFPTHELVPIIWIAVVFTICRYAFENFLCKVIILIETSLLIINLIKYNYMCSISHKEWVRRLNFNLISDAEKFPESLWKCIVYTFMWSYLFHLMIISKKYDYFFNPEKVWDCRKFLFLFYYYS